MSGFLLELLAVLSFSRRTQWAILMGVVGFFGITLLGHHTTSSIELYGPMVQMKESIRAMVDQRYDRVAYSCLISFWLLAIKFYRKDKERFYRCF